MAYVLPFTNPVDGCETIGLREFAGHEIVTVGDCDMSIWSPFEVPLSRLDFAGVEARAIRRAEALSVRGQAGDVDANIMGLLGELVVRLLLERELPSLLVSDVADDPSTPYDLEVSAADDFARRLGIEVKTTSYAKWHRRGRVISRRQFESTDDALAYVWCTTQATPKQDTLFVMGWLPRAEVKDHLCDPPAFHPRPSYSSYRPQLAQVQARRPDYDYDQDDVGYDSYGRDDYGPEDRDHSWARNEEAAWHDEDTALTDREALVKLQTPDHFWEEGLGDTSWSDRNQVRVVGAMNDMGDLADWVMDHLRHQG